MVAGILIGTVGVVLGILFFVALMAIPFEGGAKTFVDGLIKCNFLGQSLLLGTVNTVAFMLWVIISSVIVTTACAVLGSIVFEKMDIK